MEHERPRGADREHRSPPRQRRVLIRLSDDEHARIMWAARDSGLTLAGFAAEATLTAAAGSAVAPPGADERTALREALRELMAARTAVNRFVSNVNQAVAAFNATGEPPEWLIRSVSICRRAVERVDEAVGHLRRELPL